MNPYQALGVPKDASPEAIRAAYRKLARQHHPDKGGKVAEFQNIQAAYDVLADSERKARYDQTGETGTGPTRESQALSTLSTMMTALMDFPQTNVATLPLVDQLRRMLTADIQKQDMEKAKVMASIDRRKEAIKRLSKGPLADLLHGEINQREQMAAKMDEANAIRREALRLIEGETYQVDAMDWGQGFTSVFQVQL